MREQSNYLNIITTTITTTITRLISLLCIAHKWWLVWKVAGLEDYTLGRSAPLCSVFHLIALLLLYVILFYFVRFGFVKQGNNIFVHSTHFMPTKTWDDTKIRTVTASNTDNEQKWYSITIHSVALFSVCLPLGR